RLVSCSTSARVPRCSVVARAAAPQPSPLSLHDALPIFRQGGDGFRIPRPSEDDWERQREGLRPNPGDIARAQREILKEFWQPQPDRKSTRLNSSHQIISYAVFCLKKKRVAPWLQLRTPD